jgi:hypothetical protein
MEARIGHWNWETVATGFEAGQWRGELGGVWGGEEVALFCCVDECHC